MSSGRGVDGKIAYGIKVAGSLLNLSLGKRR